MGSSPSPVALIAPHLSMCVIIRYTVLNTRPTTNNKETIHTSTLYSVRHLVKLCGCFHFTTLWKPRTIQKRENKRTPWGNFKDLGAPQGIMCTKSNGKIYSTGTMERTIDVSTGMQNRECVKLFVKASGHYW